MTSRREKLELLQSSVQEWAGKEEKRLEDDVAFLRSVIEGRTSSGRVAASINREATQLIQDEVTDFLED